MEHAIAYAEKHNPERKKVKCVIFLKSQKLKFALYLRKEFLS